MKQDSISSSTSNDNFQLSKGMFWLVAIMLTTANFIAVLNITIANVSVPNIAGSLGATTSQGTWVITSYAVGEAITVPLTGWLASRFGAVRVFVGAMISFGVFSFLCGMADSIGLLVIARIFQGFSGGPLMPLSQTLLLRIFPKEKAGAAVGMWSMTTLIAPVIGPILGGYICDEYSWEWVFLINAPVAVICGFIVWKLFKGYKETFSKNPIDIVGLALLIIWVASLQLMLDEGKDLDWFSSTKIIVLAITSSIGFITFIIWEWYEEHPIVDLKVFRHRGFSISVLTISFAFAAFFGINVLTPLWLQSLMGYTATQAGIVVAWVGVTALFAAPFVANMVSKVDPRKLIFAGVLWLGIITFWRCITTTDMGFWEISIPLIFLGLGMPFFFIPTNGLALASVTEKEMDSAAGLMNFLRTLSGAMATSYITTVWNNKTIENHAELVAISDGDLSMRTTLESTGMTPDAVNQAIDFIINGQSIMIATNQLMSILGFTFIFAAFVIWLAPKPSRVVDPASSGH